MIDEPALPILNDQQLFDQLLKQHNPFFPEYYACYSSWLGGITQTPQLMVLPIDDHMVHRGDGVFEALKAVDRSVYLIDEHLQRLFISAEQIGLNPPVTFNKLKAIIRQTLQVANRDEALIRIFLSRGPGSFSVNPYDSIAPQLHVITTKLTPPVPEKYTRGIHIGSSSIPPKSPWLSQIKSCNYLPNVLMKKEAVDRHLDFVIAINDQGQITESATENIMLIDSSGTLVHPPLTEMLKGTTMTRACELAQIHNISVAVRPLALDEVYSAREIMITGTSLNVLPVVTYESQNIGDGKPGPIAKQLNQWMIQDIAAKKNGLSY